MSSESLTRELLRSTTPTSSARGQLSTSHEITFNGASSSRSRRQVSFGDHRMQRLVPPASLRRVFPGILASVGHLPSRTRIAKMASTSTWDGSGTQEDLMYRDECILVVRVRLLRFFAHPRRVRRARPTTEDDANGHVAIRSTQMHD